MPNVISISARKALLRQLHETKAGLDAGKAPAQIRNDTATRCRDRILIEARALALCVTPFAAAAYLHKLAEQLMENDAS
jgi:hypothetical protein